MALRHGIGMLMHGLAANVTPVDRRPASPCLALTSDGGAPAPRRLGAVKPAKRFADLLASLTAGACPLEFP